MLINAIEGIVENGRIRLQENVSLPDKTKVYVIVADAVQGSSAQIRSPRLAHPEQYRDFRKQVMEAPTDAGL